ncbi:MarR family winged helix-turn-helix transcriptional regulator [Paenibacillus oryzisoli]|uniref:MarR family transcriptional regulator n=1 Tax=Paenibacillus oryzisoli TaxID=1850517 RepID=A0A198ARY0_9BACL|nr:MarR family winged helix-turn-helix transcriptional regulator [Paenibacillus oryzisoli]OAS23618.1 MarR family transcriptional regulator [Paenibacillus oryzisoli]
MSEEGAWGYELTILFATAFRLAVDELHKELALLGFDDVRPSHGYVFQMLSHSGATGKEVAEHLGITKQAASLTVDYLEEHGYVLRQPHPTDQRGKLIVLTERGWDCIRATETIFTSIENRWQEVLGKDQIETLRGELRKLVYASTNSHSFKFRPVW